MRAGVRSCAASGAVREGYQDALLALTAVFSFSGLVSEISRVSVGARGWVGVVSAGYNAGYTGCMSASL
ncbi:uncharacterized [Tachysurus ichikawai]